MDKNAPQKSAELSGQEKLMMLINHQVNEVIAEKNVLTSNNMRRVVGETIAHISAGLNLTAAGYLSVEENELLAKPFLLSEIDGLGVLLVSRNITSANSYQLISKRTTVEEGKYNFEITMFKPNTFELTRTEWHTPVEPVRAELLRQLNLIQREDGLVMLCLVLVENFFPSKADGAALSHPADCGHDHGPAQAAPTPAPSPASASLLPQIDHTLL